ncbi:hypothetical protein EDC96DRAFT_435464 [Choanephora cucurbitarum]|nr:hypothetical protein EDC96DRAFT_435464 [Choanephora cucurbitarum]
MFVGDRGYSFSSLIRGLRVFALKKASHPLIIIEKDRKESFKTINGTSVCVNKTCIVNLAKQCNRPRDSSSTLIIGVSGDSKLTDTRTLDLLNPSL